MYTYLRDWHGTMSCSVWPNYDVLMKGIPGREDNVGGPHLRIKMTSWAISTQVGTRRVESQVPHRDGLLRYSVAVAPNTDTLSESGKTKQQVAVGGLNPAVREKVEQRRKSVRCHEGHEHGHAEPAYAPSPFRSCRMQACLPKDIVAPHNLAAA